MKFLGAVSLVLFLSNLSALEAGVSIRMVQKTPDGEIRQSGWLHIEDDTTLKIAADQEGSDLPSTEMLFRADEDAIYVINHSEKSFLRLDRESMGKMADQLASATAAALQETLEKMESQLSTLPPEQREAIERRLKEQMEALQEEPLTKPTPAAEVRHRGPEGRLQKYEVWQEDKLQAEVWTADPWQSGIPPQNIEAFHKLVQFLQEMTQTLGQRSATLGQVSGFPLVGIEQMNGFPVKIVIKEGHDSEASREGTILEMEEVKTKQFSPSFFRIPEGYTETEISQAAGKRP